MSKVDSHTVTIIRNTVEIKTFLQEKFAVIKGSCAYKKNTKQNKKKSKPKERVRVSCVIK